MTDPSPGDMFWDSNNLEASIECWSDPIIDHWSGPDEVYELLAAKRLPDIFVTGEVVTVDEHGDPDEVKPVWFTSKEEAEGHFQRSLEAVRAKGSKP